MFFLRSELLFILCFFPLFGFPFALFHTKECNYRSNFFGLFSPAAGKRQTAHVLCHKVDVEGTPEVFVKVAFYFGTFDEYLKKRVATVDYPEELKPRGQTVSYELASYLWDRFYRTHNKQDENA